MRVHYRIDFNDNPSFWVQPPGSKKTQNKKLYNSTAVFLLENPEFQWHTHPIRRGLPTR
jgi:hypothetical protein